MNNLDNTIKLIDKDKIEEKYKILETFNADISDVYYAYFSIFILSNFEFKNKFEKLLNDFGINDIFKMCQIDFYEGDKFNAMFDVYYRVYTN